MHEMKMVGTCYIVDFEWEPVGYDEFMASKLDSFKCYATSPQQAEDLFLEVHGGKVLIRYQIKEIGNVH